MAPTNITLSSGRAIEIDPNRITVRQFRELTDPTTDKVDEDALVAQICGIDAAELLDMGYGDYALIKKSVIEALQNPLGIDLKN